MLEFEQFLIENDRHGKSCEKCKKGKYKEMDFHDDMDGVVRCPNDKCKHYNRPVNSHKSNDKSRPDLTHAGHDAATKAYLKNRKPDKVMKP